MPKSVRKFRQSKKLAAAAVISGIVLSGQGVYANEPNNLNNSQNTNPIVEETQQEQPIKEEVKEEVKEDNKEVEEEVKEENLDKEEIKEVEEETSDKEEDKEENKGEENQSNKDNGTIEVDKVIPEQEVEDKKEDKEEVSTDYREQLHYAIEEMRIAINLLDTADLNDDDKYERLKIFYKTAVDRIKNMEVLPEDQGHIDWINQSAKEIEGKMYYIDRVRYEVNRVHTVFEESRRDTLKNKQIVLDALGDSVEVGRYNVNSTTLNSAMKLYHELYAKWDKDLEEALTQLDYAIEETREAVNCMENKDLTVKENYDRMVAFMQAALDRLEGLYVLEGLENYSEHMNNLKANLESVQDTSKLAKEIRKAMDKVINAFDNNLSRDEKIKALDELGTLVDENKYNINTWTSYTAMELYHKYYALLEDEDKDIPLIPLEPSIPVKPENPDIPLIPLEPSIPVKPENPDIPLIPLEPSIPVKPENPDIPLIPLEPSIPVKPENPDIPLIPLEPSIPVKPENPDVPLTPLQPSIPVSTNKPNTESNKKPSTNNSNNPQTGDISMLGYAGLGVSSIVGLTINRKRK